MAFNAQAVIIPDNRAMVRRRPVWGVGGLLAQSASGLVNVPGLKDAALFVKEGAKALKAPKMNDAQTRKQIDGIKGLLDRIAGVDAALAAARNTDTPVSQSITQGELDEVKSFRRDMMGFKLELESTLSEKYSSKFTRQCDIAQFLTQKNERVSECIADFCVEGSIHAHRATQMYLESNQHIQAHSALLAGQSEKIASLEYQIQTLQRKSSLSGGLPGPKP